MKRSNRTPFPNGMNKKKVEALWDGEDWTFTERYFPRRAWPSREEEIKAELLSVWQDPSALARKADFLFRLMKDEIYDVCAFNKEEQESEQTRIRAAIFFALDSALIRKTKGKTEQETLEEYQAFFFGQDLYLMPYEYRKQVYELGPRVLGVSFPLFGGAS